MKGSVIRRGKKSWRLKFDKGRDPTTGKRLYHVQTFVGTRQQAQAKLREILTASDTGTLIPPSDLTVAKHLDGWLSGPHGLSGKTAERYRELAKRQISPHLGNTLLQQLRPAQLTQWHKILLERGGVDGRPLTPLTVKHAHSVLRRGLELALKAELVSRNVARIIPPPKVDTAEAKVLQPGEMATLIGGLDGSYLQPIAIVALASGMRRGEILALRWSDVDFEAGVAAVSRALEETKEGLRFKRPKTKHGSRAVSLPPMAVEALRAHWRAQIEQRLALGQGKPDADALIFCTIEGEPLSPDNLSRDWRVTVDARSLPNIRFHDLRHSHATVLIASGLDALTVSRRLGHGNAAITLAVYTHLFNPPDNRAATAIETALRAKPKS